MTSELDAAVDAFRTFCGEEDKWKFSKEQYEVKVSSRVVEGSSLTVARGVATIKASKQKCFDFIMDPSTRTEWDKMMKEVRKVRETEDGHFIYYMQSVPKWPVSARDFVIDLYVRRYDDGTIVAFGREPEKEEVAPVSGVVRGKCINSGYMFVPNADDTATTVTFVMQLDLGGWIPSGVVNMVMVEEPLCLGRAKKLIEEGK